MSERPPRKPFSFDLPSEDSARAEVGARPFQFDVEASLEYEELRRSSDVETESVQVIESEAGAKASPMRWFVGLGLLFLILVLAIDAYTFVSIQLERSLVLGVLLGFTLAGATLALLFMVGREVRDYRRLQKVCGLRREAEAALSVPSQGQAVRLVRQFATLYVGQPLLRRRLSQFEQAITEHHTNAEILDRFTRVVIKPMDAQAYAIINRYAVDTAIVTAISPFAALDVLLSLWRNTRMIRAIASHYGVRPGLTGSFTLLKYVLQNLVTAGASHYVSDALAETMGSDLIGKLSQRFSQGAINGLMTVRLGLMAAEQCRPLPFQPEDKHNFRQLFRNVRKRHERYVEQGDAH